VKVVLSRKHLELVTFISLKERVILTILTFFKTVQMEGQLDLAARFHRFGCTVQAHAILQQASVKISEVIVTGHLEFTVGVRGS
jgi:hypothetical protein